MKTCEWPIDPYGRRKGWSSVRDRCFLHRRHGRVADAPQRDGLRVLVEVVLKHALLLVEVDEDLAVVEGFHLVEVLSIFPGLEVDDACARTQSRSGNIHRRRASTARVEHVAEQRHGPVVAERLQILDGLRALRAHQRVRVEDFGILAAWGKGRRSRTQVGLKG